MKLPDGLDDFSTNMRVRSLVSRGRVNEDGGITRMIAIQDLGGVLSREDLSKFPRKPANTTLETTPWNSLNVDVFRVVEAINGASCVTFNAQVPLKPRAIQISVSGLATEEHQLRTEMQAIVASVEGSTNWLVSGGTERRGAPVHNLVAILAGLMVLLSGRLRIGRNYGLQGAGARIAGFVIIVVGVALPILVSVAIPLLRSRGVGVGGLLIGWIVLSCALVWIAIVILVRQYGNAYARPAVQSGVAVIATPPPRPVEILITHCQMCQEPIPTEHQAVAKTCASCGADLRRRQRSG